MSSTGDQLSGAVTTNPKLPATPKKALFGLASAGIPALIIAIGIIGVHGLSKDAAISLLVCGAGIALGWLIGMLIAPYNGEEKKKFASYGGALAGLVSGYIGAKVIDPTVGFLFKENLVFQEVAYAANSLIFIIALVTSTIAGYSFRAYIAPR